MLHDPMIVSEAASLLGEPDEETYQRARNGELSWELWGAQGLVHVDGAEVRALLEQKQLAGLPAYMRSSAAARASIPARTRTPSIPEMIRARSADAEKPAPTGETAALVEQLVALSGLRPAQAHSDQGEGSPAETRASALAPGVQAVVNEIRKHSGLAVRRA
ncbi:MAG: hypothetical protein ACREOQ_06280 [Gemmatimonadales bacterium]